MITLLLIITIGIAAVSLFFNAGYIIHELGLYPHTKDRKTPKEVFEALGSKNKSEKILTHDYQVLNGWNYDLRKLGHPDVYNFKDPYDALEKVIARYKESPTRSRYDDLIHLSNYISNHVKADKKINALIDRISEITITNHLKN